MPSLPLHRILLTFFELALFQKTIVRTQLEKAVYCLMVVVPLKTIISFYPRSIAHLVFYHLDGVIANELNSREQWTHSTADVTLDWALVWSLAQAHSRIRIVLRSFQCAFREWWTWAIRKLLSLTSLTTVKIFGRCFKKNQEDIPPTPAPAQLALKGLFYWVTWGYRHITIKHQ